MELALAYREAYPEEVADQIAENEREPAEWRRVAPFVLEARR